MNGRSYLTIGLWITLGIFACLVVIPLLAAQCAEWFLHANGCRFDLKAGTTCILAGSDWGPFLGHLYFWPRFLAFGLGIWLTLLSAAAYVVDLFIRHLASRRNKEST